MSSTAACRRLPHFKIFSTHPSSMDSNSSAIASQLCCCHFFPSSSVTQLGTSFLNTNLCQHQYSPSRDGIPDLLSNFTGMEQKSMAFFSCHSPVKKRAATVLGSPSIFCVLLGDVLPKLWWCVAGQVSLAKSRTDQIHHHPGAIHRYQSCKITSCHSFEELGKWISIS
jgi:hypothetical protein